MVSQFWHRPSLLCGRTMALRFSLLRRRCGGRACGYCVSVVGRGVAGLGVVAGVERGVDAVFALAGLGVGVLCGTVAGGGVVETVGVPAVGVSDDAGPGCTIEPDCKICAKLSRLISNSINLPFVGAGGNVMLFPFI